MKPTLKEILKPPFKWALGSVMSGDTVLLHLGTDPLLLSDNDFDSFKGFIVAALNEKWERDFGEPLRWEIKPSFEGYDIVCPKCKTSMYGDHVSIGYNYCPSCGRRLLPPKEE